MIDPQATITDLQVEKYEDAVFLEACIKILLAGKPLPKGFNFTVAEHELNNAVADLTTTNKLWTREPIKYI